MCDDLTAERRGRRTTTTAGTGAGTGRTRTTAARLTAAAGGLRYLTGTDLGTRLPAAVDVEVRHFEHTGLQLRRQTDVVHHGLLVLVAVGGAHQFQQFIEGDALDLQGDAAIARKSTRLNSSH